MSEMDDVLKEFLIESFENLDRLDHDFLSLEERPQDRETLSRIFRAIHTVKGTCGFLGFAKLEKLAHAGETLLSKLRDGALALDKGMTDALLAMVDAVRRMLKLIEETGVDGDDDYAAMRATLAEFAAGGAPKPAEAAAPPAAVETSPPPPPPKTPTKFGEIAVDRKILTPAQVDAALEAQRAGDSRKIGEILTVKGQLDSADAEEIARAQAAAAAAKPAQSVADNSVRIDVGLLDRMMTLVGELVLARNQMLQFVHAKSDAKMSAAAQRLSLITSELQESVMKTRMQPVGGAWGKIPRIVRDLAQALKKKIRVEMTGQDVELDRSIIEAIKDPLTHVVRNSCDHGIETPEERVAAGKPAEGRLSIRAFHEGGRVNIEIADDGGGVRAEKVKRKALEKGLITPEQAGRMTDRELQNLIFLPGFSTAEAVTNVSGRGVGMDVVKTNIEHIGGTVDVTSVEGRGTTLKIRIPLTLAIVPALTVRVGGERYGIPQVNLLELVRLGGEKDEGGARLESIHGASVFRLRGKLLPVVRLRDVVSIPEGAAEPEEQHVVVLQADDRRFGLIVDDVCDTGEIVVKPLAARLKSLGIFAGATIMGDGGVVLILDVMGLAHASRVVVEGRRGEAARAASEGEADAAAGAGGSYRSWLVTEAGGRRFALPLDEVARLEEFPTDRLERAADAEVVQYRGDLLPIVRVRDSLGMPPAEAQRSVHVVVCGAGDAAAGFVFDEVLDIVEERAALRRGGGGRGVAGAVVIQGRTADVLDVAALVRAAGR